MPEVFNPAREGGRATVSVPGVHEAFSRGSAILQQTPGHWGSQELHRQHGEHSLKHLILLVAIAALAAGCGHDRHRHDRDRDHNGIPDRYERNRDSDRDGIPDRYDRRPYDPRRY